MKKTNSSLRDLPKDAKDSWEITELTEKPISLDTSILNPLGGDTVGLPSQAEAIDRSGARVQNPPYFDVSSANSNNSVSDWASMRKVPVTSYLCLKMAAAIIPVFDGKAIGTLTKFVKQCKMVESRVKPCDRANLLLLIRSKIVGHADQLISHKSEPETLEGLISLLKSSFARVFDVDAAHAELVNQKQTSDETIEVYGARVSAILNRALEAACERFDAAQNVGVRALLDHAAVNGFAVGLRDRLLSTLLASEQKKNLDEAISTALRLQKITESRQTLFGTCQQENVIKSSHREARVNKIDIKDIICYDCNERGHMRAKCPNRRPWGNRVSAPYSKKFCKICKKPGHIDEECWGKDKLLGCRFCKKKNHVEADCYWRDEHLRKESGTEHQKGPENENSNHLNANRAPRDAESRSSLITGRANLSESVTKST